MSESIAPSRARATVQAFSSKRDSPVTQGDAKHPEEKTAMIDATYLKAHRTATNVGAKKRERSPD